MKLLHNNTHLNTVMLRVGKLFFLVGLALMLTVSTFAQTGDETDDEATNTSDEVGDPGGDVDTPFNGGVPVLVIAGLAYGAWYWNNARKNVQQQQVQ